MGSSMVSTGFIETIVPPKPFSNFNGGEPSYKADPFSPTDFHLQHGHV